MQRTVAAACVGAVLIATTACAQVSIPEVTLPTDGAAFLSWVRTNVDRGLEVAGIHPERFPTFGTFVEKFAEIQFIRVDDIPVISGVWEKARDTFEGTLGIEALNLAKGALGYITRLFEAGIEWVKSSTK